MTPVDNEVLEGLSRGIQAELAAYVFYKKALALNKDENLDEVLKWLAGEEKEHYAILEGQYRSLIKSERWVAYNDIMKKEGLPDIDEHTEKVHDTLIEEVDENTSPKRILEIALLLEVRARDIYQELEEKTENPEGKKTYGYLVRFEAGHIAKIKSIAGKMGIRLAD